MVVLDNVLLTIFWHLACPSEQVVVYGALADQIALEIDDIVSEMDAIFSNQICRGQGRNEALSETIHFCKINGVQLMG